MISGPDQLDFLQRQTTNDINLLSPGHVLPTVLTSPTARILDVFYLFSESGSEARENAREGNIGILTTAGSGDRIYQYLESRIFFIDKVSLTNLSQDFCQIDLFGLDAPQVLHRIGITNPPETLEIALAEHNQSNYLENPWLDQEYIDNVVHAMRDSDYKDYEQHFLGEPLSDDEERIIKRSHVTAAIDAHLKLDIEIRGTRRRGFDVADDGEDLCATVNIHGNLINGCSTWKGREDEILQSCTRVWNEAKQTESEVVYDAIGVRASCGAKFNELGRDVKHTKFFAGGAVINPDSYYSTATKIKNKDFYSNVKAQAWWHVAERLKNTYNAVHNGQQFTADEMLFIDSNTPELEQLITELCTPRKAFDSAGRVMVESKKDLKKRDKKSPNRADAFIMAAISKALLKTSGGYLF